MKASIIRKYGGNEVIEFVEDFPKPEVGDDEILIEMRAEMMAPV